MESEGVVIAGEEYDVDKTVTISTKDLVIETVDQDVLVLRKGSYHRKRSAEVGDGMEVVMGFARDPLSVGLDNSYVGYGLQLYHEFDEQANETTGYLYGFGHDEEQLAALNNILKENNVELTVERDGKFIAVVGSDDFLSLDQIKEKITFQQAASILFGIFLGYGKFVSDDEAIHHAIINLPMIGSVPQYELLFKKVIDCFAEQGVFIRSEYIDTRNGQAWQVDIYDWELLQLLKLRSNDPRTVAKFDQIQDEKPRIIAFLQEHGFHSEVVDMLQEGIFKLRKR